MMAAMKAIHVTCVFLYAWLFGLATFLYIVSVAFSKSVLGWFAFF
jgi:hypothetical protein